MTDLSREARVSTLRYYKALEGFYRSLARAYWFDGNRRKHKACVKLAEECKAKSHAR